MVNYTCNECGKTFDRKSNYINHLNRKIKCSNKQINNIQQIEQNNNLNINHNVADKPKNMVDKSNKMADELKISADNSNKMADIFDNMFVKNVINQLKQPTENNIQQVGEKNKRQFECIICKKIFNHRQSLFKHIKKHENYEKIIEKNKQNGIFQCSICNHYYKSIIKLDKHYKIKHNKTNINYENLNNNIVINGNNNIVNNNVVNNNIINIVNFGDEDIDKISRKDIVNILFNEQKPLTKLI